MKQTYNDKEYFDLKFLTIEEQMQHLTKLIEGNGKPGLIKRVEVIENAELSAKSWMRGALYIFGGAMTVMGFFWFKYGLPFIEEVSHHLTGR